MRTVRRPQRLLSLFRDDEQRGRACRALLATQGLGHLWGAEGAPTQEALALLRATPSDRLATGQRCILFVAWALWKKQPWVLDELFHESLDVDQLVLVMTLAIAMRHGAEMIDVWLAHYEKRDAFLH